MDDLADDESHQGTEKPTAKLGLPQVPGTEMQSTLSVSTNVSEVAESDFSQQCEQQQQQSVIISKGQPRAGRQKFSRLGQRQKDKRVGWPKKNKAITTGSNKQQTFVPGIITPVASVITAAQSMGGDGAVELGQVSSKSCNPSEVIAMTVTSLPASTAESVLRNEQEDQKATAEALNINATKQFDATVSLADPTAPVIQVYRSSVRSGAGGKRRGTSSLMHLMSSYRFNNVAGYVILGRK